MTTSQRQALEATGVDVRFDNLTRQLYATDASIYRVEPWAVAFPRDAGEAAAVMRASAAANVPIIPRGAGSGLVGGAIGEGLVVEFARHNRQITELNLDRRTVRVGPGVVLDQLNGFLRPHGFGFGPDVATSSRATLGGMIANNSSGAHVPVYGTTASHVVTLQLALADGRIATVGPGHRTLPAEHDRVAHLIRAAAPEIQARMPGGLQKRWPGYGLDLWLRQPDHLGHVLAGSEGTLAAIVSAELNIVPLPPAKGLGLIFFPSVAEAMAATVQLLDLRPAAIEHVDRILFDQTKGQRPFQAARDLMRLDTDPCESILMVEFFEDIEDRLAALEKRRLGLRHTLCTKPAEMNLIWALRKAGLSLLTGCPGSAKPVTGIEDTAVRPEHLPRYVAGLRSILGALGLEACFYGHAATGLLHLRPVLDLHSPADLVKFRQAANEVSALVREFQGSLCGEHGVGIARTEFLPDHLGSALLEVMRGIKAVFDPRQLMNPGKIVGDGRFKIDTRLRWDAEVKLDVPGPSVLAFAAKDGSFTANLEQCNGCGGCRKDAPTMCPTFAATGEELMSTRGRANLIRAVLEHRGLGPADPLESEELEAALGNCLSCKACTTECPSNVNLALLKAELLHAKHQRHGLGWRERLLGSVDALGRWGCRAPSLANAMLANPAFRRLLARLLGIHPSRPLPRFARRRFELGRRPRPTPAARGRVILWDDTFVRYHEPQVGRAAVAVLETAGFEVLLARGRQCCGRPAFSQGWLDQAARLGSHNLRLLQRWPSEPIVFLEPSCWSMFVEDCVELKLPGARETARRCHLFETFVDALLEKEPDALRFRPQTEAVAIHAHCHAKSLMDASRLAKLAARLPGRTASLMNTGCCGMAGAFGALESKYALSLQVADPLVRLVNSQPAATRLIASGTSCRQQIHHLTPAHPLHMAEWLAQCLDFRASL